jgi:hypothetical protein
MKVENWKILTTASVATVSLFAYMGYRWEKERRRLVQQRRKDNRKESTIDIGGK